MLVYTIQNVATPTQSDDSVFPLVLSVIALIISIASIVVDRRKSTLEIITKNRMDWIADVRNLIKEFIEEYVNERNEDNKKNLIILRNKISLYIRDGVTSYKELIDQLDYCVSNEYNESDCNKLIKKSQNVLSEVWIRMKREAGIGKKEDNKYSKMFESKYK